MDRKKWATALRCLEVALHPNTADEEVLAAVNGFRRTVGSASISEMVAGLVDRSSGDLVHVTPPPQWPEAVARLAEENQRLLAQLESRERSEAELQRRLCESDGRVSVLRDASLAAEARVEKAESLLAELLTAYGTLSDQNRDLHTALAATRRSIAETPRRSMSSPFRSLLAAARSRMEPSSSSARPTAATASGDDGPWRAGPYRHVDGTWTA